MTLSEADTSKFIIPRLQAAGRNNDRHSIAEKLSLTEGRIVPASREPTAEHSSATRPKHNGRTLRSGRLR